MELILKPFAWLFLALYNGLNSYGLALIVFAFLIKLVLFPLNLKGKRSMIGMNMLQGKMQQLQKECGKDKTRYNQEVQRLYEKEKINPMGGCLWTMLPLPIMIGLYYVIRQPLQYFMEISSDLIDTVGKVLGIANTGAYPQIAMAKAMGEPGMLDAVKEVLVAAGAAVDKLFVMDFSFLGLDLSQTPQWKFWEVGSFSWAYIGLFVIPFISAGLGFVSSRVSMKTNKMNNKQPTNSQADAMSKQMLFMMPIMSLWIGFVMPAGLGIYWMATNILTILQEMIAAKLLKKDYEKAHARQAEQERLEKEEEKKKKAEIAARRVQQAEEAKLNKGKKKPVTEKKKPTTSEAGRIGMRAYARGRSYEANRYGEVTEYHDPSVPVDEAAVEAALGAKTTQALQPEELPESAAVVELAETAEANEQRDPAVEAESAVCEEKAGSEFVQEPIADDTEEYEAEAAPETEEAADEDEVK